MQRALDEVHPHTGVLFGRSGWSGQQAIGFTWAGDQASDFWSLRALVAATLTAAASGFSNWSHDVGGYLGRRLVERCPRELLLRWVQFGCFTPLMQAHGRFDQEAWRYDLHTLDVYRDYLLLHERLVPYIRAAAATASRSGLPIIRPLCLADPSDPRGWQIADAYLFGPSLWVAPVLGQGVRRRPVDLPRGDWVDLWTGEPVAGGGRVLAEAPRSEFLSGSGAARSLSRTRSSTWQAGSATRRRPLARWRRRSGGCPAGAGPRPGWPAAPESAGETANGPSTPPTVR